MARAATIAMSAMSTAGIYVDEAKRCNRVAFPHFNLRNEIPDTDPHSVDNGSYSSMLTAVRILMIA